MLGCLIPRHAFPAYHSLSLSFHASLPYLPLLNSSLFNAHLPTVFTFLCPSYSSQPYIHSLPLSDHSHFCSSQLQVPFPYTTYFLTALPKPFTFLLSLLDLYITHYASPLLLPTPIIHSPIIITHSCPSLPFEEPKESDAILRFWFLSSRFAVSRHGLKMFLFHLFFPR